MGNAFKIFLLGVGLAGLAAYLGRRVSTRLPMQDDAGNPVPGA